MDNQPLLSWEQRIDQPQESDSEVQYSQLQIQQQAG